MQEKSTYSPTLFGQSNSIAISLQEIAIYVEEIAKLIQQKISCLKGERENRGALEKLISECGSQKKLLLQDLDPSLDDYKRLKQRIETSIHECTKKLRNIDEFITQLENEIDSFKHQLLNLRGELDDLHTEARLNKLYC